MNTSSAPFAYIALPVAIGAGSLLVAWSVQRRMARKRTEAFRTEAQRLGFNFEGMTGSRDGLSVSIFDYRYVHGRGKGTRNYRQTVGAFSKSGAYFPYFELRPSGAADKVWDAVAHKNIHFDSDAEFSRRYVLRGSLQDKVRSLFAPPLRAFLEGLDSHEKWRIEGAGETLILYRSGKRVPPGELRLFLEQTASMALAFFGIATATAVSH